MQLKILEQIFFYKDVSFRADWPQRESVKNFLLPQTYAQNVLGRSSVLF